MPTKPVHFTIILDPATKTALEELARKHRFSQTRLASFAIEYLISNPVKVINLLIAASEES